jgi:SAM-dependent methyltransferase
MDQKGESGWFASGNAYENYVGRWSRPIAYMFVEWLSQSAGLRWVDVGCGTGALTEVVLAKADPSKIIGVEPSAGYLERAQASIKDPRVEFYVGDAQSLPLGDHQVDTVVSGLVLNFIPDKRRALAEMQRIVVPGGTIALYVWDYAGDMQLMRYFWNGVGELFPDAKNKDEGIRFSDCKPGPLVDLFCSAGLRSVETCALDVPTVFTNFEDYWSPFLGGQGPAGAYCVSLSENDRERLRRHLRDSLPINADGTIGLIARAWAVRGRT